MKMNRWLMSMIAGLALGSGAMAAEDFSVYSIEELQQKRNEVRTMSDADRTAFMQEMQKRMSSMSDEERAQFRQGSGGGDGSGRRMSR
ncbi:MAG: hypothetical protein OQK94_05445 [Gammaproteobacteria bacterium]|nr:hypothetical protein [Gammaproteobacteria bacterium]MCW8839534.1 hypothetical protein [Gammaproteobacteria bacterium]MCW8958954.1 hypothetical protein [Gammaproteobacteria bacterium]MCW8972380.1 hypothetical protein [Gammaproteobacteria bacterium]MCW8992630.1 hypothetical protein [Gammaproteobacteria bacterium]